MTVLVAHVRRAQVPVGAAIGFLALSLFVGRLLDTRGMTYALAFAALPALLLLFGTQNAVPPIILAAVAATTAFGRDFAYIGVTAPKIGRLYVLDAVLALVLVCGVPTLVGTIRRNRPQVFVIGGILLLTFAELLRRPLSTEALRDSVIGLYSLWALGGMLLTERQKLAQLARAVYVGSLVATPLFALYLASPNNSITNSLTPKLAVSSYSLYLGYGILLMIFAPSFGLARHRRELAYGIAIVQGALVAIGQSRSLWVAIAIAIVGTALAGGMVTATRTRILRAGAAFAALAALATVLVPSVSARIAADANTIVSYNSYAAPAGPVTTPQIKAENAQWRLKRWRQAATTAVHHPAFGIGFGGPVINDPATDEAYKQVGEIPPRIDPHNSFIAFAARFGLPGFLLLLLFETAVVRSAMRLLRSSSRGVPRELIAWLLASQLLTVGVALFNVVLEGPYMGLFFWLFGGALIALDNLARSDPGASEEALLAGRA